MLRRIFSLAGLALIALSSAGCGSSGGEAKESNPFLVLDLEALPVETYIAERKIVPIQLRGTAITEPSLDALLVAPASATVRSVLVSPGDSVPRGSSIIAVNDAVIRAQNEQARLAEVQAEDSLVLRAQEYETAKALFEKGRLSEHELLASKLAYSTAEAQHWAAKAAFAQTSDVARKIRGPVQFDGQVAAIYVDIGDQLQPGSPIARIVQLDPLKLHFGASEREIRRIEIGQPVMASFPNSTQSTPDIRQGIVQSVAPVPAQGERTWQVEIMIENPQRVLPAGLVADLLITVDSGDPALVVPLEAVLEEEASVVFVVEEGIAQRRPVTLGKSQGNFVEVISGLQLGEVVVTTGNAALRSGSAVSVQPQ